MTFATTVIRDIVPTIGRNLARGAQGMAFLDLCPRSHASATMPQGTSMAKRALIVFEDRHEPAWLRLLTPGFRHCFCVVGGGLNWTIIDPLLSRIEVLPFCGLDEDGLAEHYRRTGRTVVAGRISSVATCKAFIPRPLTCVEVVKRTLNLDAPGVLTPRQLYRVLTRSPAFRPI